ncbi:MAG: FeoB-associated Cys-rich membrane protein [Eubacteriales bacterium]|nr:FeoB-associated Cys-rich membrane protein [Eubacteriales bacterium]
MGTIAAGAVVLLLAGAAIASMIKDKKNGKSLQCGGDCKHCGGHCGHH